MNNDTTDYKQVPSNSRGGGKKREVLYDVIKGIGIILMVIGHTCGQPLYSWIYSFHMPLFFIISGLFFQPKRYTIMEFLTKRYRQLLLPLIIFTTFVIVIGSMLIPEQNMIGKIKHSVLPGALWFLLVLFVLQVFYFIIVKVVKANKLYLLLISIVSMFVGKLLNAYGTNFLYIGTVFSAMPFYSLAHLFSSEIRKINQLQIGCLKLCMFSAVCFIVPLVVVLYTDKTISLWNNVIPSPITLYYIIACIGSLGVFFMALSIVKGSKRVVSILSYLGRNTIPIVALNQLIIDLSTKYITCNSHVCTKIIQQILIWSICLLVIKFCNCHFKMAVGK